ncbi:hypothetical protein CTAYLR_004807 [Chrysophaeum taylorii]|uniref:RCK N-terminal domain-containing protein n=1 Tax=Chrysophaeum taylorii TaxID=2483200 RepID=A0AAD7XRF2_9STRA|nr:hypothetical protein CTAYLR_004807 [Chrysophaeum taylorii]
MATVLGVVVDVIREKMDQLKVGKRVIEHGHSIIFGWTDRAPLVINELLLANESEGGGVIVIMAEAPNKDVIEAQILHRFRRRLRGSRIIVRNGSSMLMQDLQKVAVDRAKVSILLSDPSGDADEADAASLRQILTIRSLPALDGFVVVEIRDVDNEPLVRLVGGSMVETIVSHDIIGRMMVMSSRNPGLSRVYSEVLGFDGDEFYMASFPEIEGVAFGDLQAMFPDAIPIGIASADEHCIWLKPSVGRITKPGEKIIVIAEDDDTFSPQPAEDVAGTEAPRLPPKTQQKELILFCGWRRDIRDIILHLDRLVMSGSCIHMCTDAIPLSERDVRLQSEGLNFRSLKNVTVEHFNINTSVRRKVAELPLEEYTSILIFPDQRHEGDIMRSDSHVIATLLLIRDIQRQRNKEKILTVTTLNTATANRVAEGIESWRKHVALTPKTPIICEILDPRTQATIEANLNIAGSSDFCQSNRLIAQVLAMVSENRGVKLLIDELLSADGTSFRVMRASSYVAKGEILNFYELGRRCLRQKGEVLVGYQHSHDFVTVINPRDKRTRRSWDNDDLVVLHGTSRLKGQDRTKANVVIAALNQQSSRRDRVSLDADGMERLRNARTTSITSSINSTIARHLAQLRIEDLQWLQSKIQAEIRTRDMSHVSPLVLPLDPALEKVIDNLNNLRATVESVKDEAKDEEEEDVPVLKDL